MHKSVVPIPGPLFIVLVPHLNMKFFALVICRVLLASSRIKECLKFLFCGIN